MTRRSPSSARAGKLEFEAAGPAAHSQARGSGTDPAAVQSTLDCEPTAHPGRTADAAAIVPPFLWRTMCVSQYY